MNSTLVGYYINNVYLINPKTIIVKLHHREKEELRLIISINKGIWITHYDFPKRSGGIATKLRKHLLRAKVLEVVQPSSERISIIHFSIGIKIIKLVIEFFGGGNIIVIDEKDKIEMIMHTLKVRHRTLRVNSEYMLPPSRGADLLSLSLNDLDKIKTTNLEVSKWLGRNLSLSKKYIEEALENSRIDPHFVGSTISTNEISELFTNLKNLIKISDRVLEDPIVYYKTGIPIEAAPFNLRTFENYEYKKFSSFMEAIDEVMSFEILSEIKESQFEPLKVKMEELKNSIQKQDVAEKKTYQNSKILRRIAYKIQEKKDYQKRVSPELLAEFGIDKLSLMKGILTIGINGIRIKIDAEQSMMKLSSKLFSVAKDYERKLLSIKEAKARLKAELETINHKSRTYESNIDSNRIIIKTKKNWYEKYRWFFTSDSFLAVGGRDSSTNSIIISKYTDIKDLVFHADIYGSPFFILKGTDPPETSIQEVAQATVIFSRAWKDGYSVGDAYWVHPSQVKRAAPSGMYLSKGSFLISGSKNYLRNLKNEIAIGISRFKDQFKVISGPSSAVRKNSIAFVIVVPEKGKTSDTAKKIKAELINLLEDSVDITKKNLDEFIRSMPTGSGRIISKEFGEQRYKKLLDLNHKRGEN